LPDFTAVLGRDIKGLRIGLPKEYFIDGLHPEVEASVRKGIAKLEALGAHIEEISLPHTEAGVATYYVLAPAEASANAAWPPPELGPSNFRKIFCGKDIPFSSVSNCDIACDFAISHAGANPGALIIMCFSARAKISNSRCNLFSGFSFNRATCSLKCSLSCASFDRSLFNS
jgi:hypothetical protein